RPHVAHLRLRTYWCHHRHLHRHASDVVDLAAGAGKRDRNLPRPQHPPRLSGAPAPGRAPLPRQWPTGLTKEDVIQQLNSQLKRELVSVDFNLSQYSQDNSEEAVSSVKGENSVKIFGRDLPELERLSKGLRREIAGVPGVSNPGGFNLLGQPNLVIKIDRA